MDSKISSIIEARTAALDRLLNFSKCNFYAGPS